MIAEQRELVRRFVDGSRAYCMLVEGCEVLDTSVLAREAASLLAILYAAGLSLANVRPVSEEPAEAQVSLDSVADAREMLGGKFGRHDLYWTVYYPFQAEEPVAATLGDDLADIYRDLKDGLDVFDGGSERDILDAVWHWRFGFEPHWGRHAVEALRTLHNVISDCPLAEQAEDKR